MKIFIKGVTKNISTFKMLYEFSDEELWVRTWGGIFPGVQYELLAL
jgi:hypothetical protein